MKMLREQWPFKILLAVDGSEHARAAVQLLYHLPLPPGSSVTAVGVLTPRQTPRREVLLVALDQARMILKYDNKVMVTTELLHGHPAEAITEFADGQKPDLIVVGAKGLRATLGILLGGMAQQVVEYSRWPVLVVRPPYQGLHRVLLVTDGSSQSQHAVSYLARFPLPISAEVRVMHVLPSRDLPEPVTLVEPIGLGALPTPLAAREARQAIAEIMEYEKREGQAIVEQAAEALKSAEIEAASTLVRGDAATEIIEYVKEHSIDLVVSGSRGLSAVKGWLLGSVSRKLVHDAGCSVLIVKGTPRPVE
jgi:nucleotide-binding universal stress UspA family protein